MRVLCIGLLLVLLAVAAPPAVAGPTDGQPPPKIFVDDDGVCWDITDQPPYVVIHPCPDANGSGP